MPFRWVLVWSVSRKSSAAAEWSSFYGIPWVWVTFFKAVPVGQVVSVKAENDGSQVSHSHLGLRDVNI